METDKMLEIAREVINMNKDLNAALSGSLLFIVSGKRIRRNPQDIDIIVQYLCEKEEGFPNVPVGFTLNYVDGLRSDVNAIQFINKDGVKIDFISSDEKRATKQYKGVDYIVGDVDEAINAKIYYSENDKDFNSRNKHLNDLIYMIKKPLLSIGTKSVLFGAHCFFLHPIFVAIAWIRLYGFPLDIRIWIAFFVHDLGYLGKPNMDGPEGETHVELGAKIMHIFDGYESKNLIYGSKQFKYYLKNILENNIGWKVSRITRDGDTVTILFTRRKTYWRNFSLYHSRYYAKKNNASPSLMCYADKLAFATTPKWLYMMMVCWTGEIEEYFKNAMNSNCDNNWKSVKDKDEWFNQLRKHLIKWVAIHKDGKEDTWTNKNRHD